MSSFGFSNGAYNRATGTLNAFGGLSDQLVREGYPRMVSRSGDREYEDQLRIWHDRMVPYEGIRGRKVYGKKKWQGKWWYRIHPATVAVPTNPPTSNHGKRRSNDLLYPYNNRNTKAHKRARVLAPRYGISWEGVNFDEDWHWTFWGALGKILARPGKGDTAAVPKPVPEPVLEEDESEEDTMKVFGYIRPADGRLWYVTMDFAGGLWHETVSNDPKYGISIAKNWGGGGAPKLTPKDRDGYAAKFRMRWPELASMTDNA